MKSHRSIFALVAFATSLFTACVIASRHGVFAGGVMALVVYTLFSVIATPREAACFVNNFGVLNNTILLHDAFSLFLKNLLPIKNMVLDVQDPKTGARTAKPGDTITIKDWRTQFTAYQPNPTYVAQDVTAGPDTTVTLPNLAWAVSYALSAAEFRVLSSGATGGKDYDTFRNKIAEQMRNSLGRKLISLFFAQITAANYPDVPSKFVSAPGTFTRSTEVDMETALFDRDIPTDGMQVICNSALYGEWTKDHIAIQTQTGEDRPKGLLMSAGRESDSSAFSFFRTSLPLPADASRGLAMLKSAMVAAFRAPDEATFENDPVSLNLVVEAVTQVPMLTRLWKNAATGAIQLDLATIPLFVPGQKEGMLRILPA